MVQAARASPGSRERMDALQQVFGNGTTFHSTLDFPTRLFYKELLQMYPHAKVLLNVRDSPAAWWKSAKSTIIPLGISQATPRFNVGIWLLFKLNPLFAKVGHLFAANYMSLFPAGPEDDDVGIAAYARHIEDVKATVPAAQLLVFNVKDGWAPLARFLNASEPRVEFPNSNSASHFQNMMLAIAIAGWAHLVVLVAGLALLLRLVMRCVQKTPRVGKKKDE
jgi:hypothetical protein